MATDELEANLHLFNEFQSDGYIHESKTNCNRENAKRSKLRNGSAKSPDVNVSRSSSLFHVTGILLFAIVMLGGRRNNDHPSSVKYSLSILSMRHDAIVNNVSNTTSIPQITLGAWYYPWYGGDFHRGDGYVRKLLNQRPVLGEYDDRNPETIRQHLHWSRQGNIGLWVMSWWGPHTREDNTTRTVILKHKDLQKGGAFEDHKIALFYETFGRIRKEEQYSLNHIRPDMEFVCQNYLTHPNYYTLENGRPVLFMYLTRQLETLVRFESVIHMIRKAVNDTCGKDIYIVGDQIFGRFDPKFSAEQRLLIEEDRNDNLYSPAPAAFDLLDGVTTYDVYGSMAQVAGTSGGYQTEAAVTEYYLTEQRKWRSYVKKRYGCSFIPSVAPGYNDLGVRPEAKHTPLARALQKGRDNEKVEGSFFRLSLKKARTLVDPSASYLLMVNSFNEWHEDTQIEPATGKSTSKPFNLTHGIEYHGYETLYLDILRNVTIVMPILVYKYE